METEMKLETHFALGIKLSKHSGSLDVQFPFKLMTKVVLSSFELNFCEPAQECIRLWTNTMMLFVPSSLQQRLCFPTHVKSGGSTCMFKLLHHLGKAWSVCSGMCCCHWEAGRIWWRGVSYSCMSRLIMCTSWLPIKSLFSLISCWYHSKYRDLKMGEHEVWQVGRPKDIDSNMKVVVGACCDTWLIVSAVFCSRVFLDVSQSLSKRKVVNASRKCSGVSFSEKTGAKVTFCFPPHCGGSILTEHCHASCLVFMLFLKNVKALWNLLVLMLSLTGKVRRLQKQTKEYMCIEI